MDKLPLIYHPRYDFTLFGIEKLHPFDSTKYSRIHAALMEEVGLQPDQFRAPEPVGEKDLLEVHAPEYLKGLYKSREVARIAEISPLRYLPNFLLQWRLLTPMKYATGGTILGAELAMKEGWAINLGGGFHHAKSNFSSGFCFFADIPLAAHRLLQNHPELKKIMVVDLDAHQGNGFEAIFKDDPRFVSFDVYNGSIYPLDYDARKFIKYDYPVKPGMKDQEYLDLVERELPKALDAEQPDFIFYNAGSDIYEKDPLGGFKVSGPGIMRRDVKVFREAIQRGIPILKVLSGGYHPLSYMIITESIKTLLRFRSGGKSAPPATS